MNAKRGCACLIFLVLLAFGDSAAFARTARHHHRRHSKYQTASTPATPSPISNVAADLGLTSKKPESAPWSIVALLTLLTFLPALLLCVTPFARLLVIFHFLRQALGTQTAPTNQVLIGLALVLTFFVMQPVVADVQKIAVDPLQNGSITTMQAIDRGSVPLRTFMLRYTREKDLSLFVEMSHSPRPRGPQDLPMRVVAPAYMISELKTGFQVGAVLFLPFLVIDMVVASVTTSIGMLQLPPVVISTPLKIMLFVMVDGWNLLVGSLLKSFY
jgi:flagellar biosynthesis protein FliP